MIAPPILLTHAVNEYRERMPLKNGIKKVNQTSKNSL